MAEKLPFTKPIREEITRAAQTVSAGGLRDTEFWDEFERELSRVSAYHAKRVEVTPRKIKG